MTWQERLSTLVHTAEALAYMHSHDPPIAHRDVKCGNVLLTRGSDGGMEAKVADFGTARTSKKEELMRTTQKTHSQTQSST